MSTITIVCNEIDDRVWDSYVEAHPDARFCHLSGYRFLERVYGFRPRWFGIRKDGRLVGVLPVFEANSLFFGRRMVSQPFCEYGGFLLDPDLSEADIQTAVAEIRRMLGRAGISTLEMHGSGLPPAVAERQGTQANPQFLADLPLDKPLEEMRRKQFSKSIRRGVDKARAAGFETRNACDPDLLRGWFYPLYLKSMKRLGVPPHPLDYFLTCYAALGDRMRIQWAIKDSKPVTGLLGFICGERISLITIASDRDYWAYAPNDYVAFELVGWAIENGLGLVDYGNVRYEGQQMWKQKWGCRLHDHAFTLLAPPEAEKKAGTFSSSSRFMTTMAKLWSDYMPMPLALRLGPFLRQNLVR